MKPDLVKLEQDARSYRKAGMFDRAIELFSTIVDKQGDWEHGLCYYEMGLCYEELGNLKEAEKCFRKALSYDPNYYLYLSGLASFLYLHGDVHQAFDAHIELLKIYARNRDAGGIEKARIALNNLGKKMGLANHEVVYNIGRALGDAWHKKDKVTRSR